MRSRRHCPGPMASPAGQSVRSKECANVSDGMDVIFLSSADPREDAARLEQVLAAGLGKLLRVLLVLEGEPSEDVLTRRLASTSLQWLVVRGGQNTGGVNRALLLRERDALLVLPWVTLEGGCIEELHAASNLHDRVAAIVPATHAGEVRA